MLDILLGLTVFMAARAALVLLDAPSPGAIAIAMTFAVLTWRLQQAGSSWAEFGLRAPTRWLPVAGWVVACYALVAAASFLVVAPLASRFGWPPIAVERLGELTGNLPLLAGLLALAWTTAALGEELLFRGFLQARLTSAMGGGGVALAAAILMQAALFGAAHAYLGARGMATAGVVGLIYGVVFVVSGGNLWPLIIAHGLTDTVSLVALYAGVRPPGAA